jgi:hypothetical protein
MVARPVGIGFVLHSHMIKLLKAAWEIQCLQLRMLPTVLKVRFIQWLGKRVERVAVGRACALHRVSPQPRTRKNAL